MPDVPSSPDQSGIGRLVSEGRDLSRRAVLRTGAIGLAATGAISAFPGLLGSLAADGPEVSGDATGTAAEVTSGAAPALDGPIVAHIQDVTTGDISIYVGEQEIAYRDPALVDHLLRATQK